LHIGCPGRDVQAEWKPPYSPEFREQPVKSYLATKDQRSVREVADEFEDPLEGRAIRLTDSLRRGIRRCGGTNRECYLRMLFAYQLARMFVKKSQRRKIDRVWDRCAVTGVTRRNRCR
jgi:hypothetical protein